MDGDADAAVTLVRATLAKVPETLLDLRADLYRELGTALAATGETTVSAAAFRETRRLYEQKGNVSGVRRLHDELRAVPA